MDLVLNQTREELFHNFDPLTVDGNVINEKGANIIITRTKKNNNNDNDINLGECEDKLKEHYNISQNDSLYLLRIDIQQVGMTVGTFEYEVLYPIEDDNLKKLNLTVCKDVKIDIVIPLNISAENVEKYNKSSPYYNDICYISNTDDGTDISLNDRKQEYVNNNMSVCEDNCDFISYNTETQKAVCSCGIKTDVPFMDNVKFDKDVLMNGFTDISNIANTKLMTCYKTIFQKKLILKNIGCFIFATLIFLNLICFFLFLFKYYNKLVQKINKVKNNIINCDKNIKNQSNNIRIKRASKKSIDNNIIEREKSNNERNIIQNNKSIRLKKKNKLNKNKNVPPKKKQKIKLNKINNDNNKYKNPIINIENNNLASSKRRSNYTHLLNKKNKKQKNTTIKKELIIKLNYSELNALQFRGALKKDNRTYIQNYISLLKINHMILCIFYSNDYNSKIIKLSIFFFTFSSYISVNALFFNDTTMHKIYTDGGSYNFIYQLPQIIYSTIISAVLNGIIKLLGLSESNILKMKKEILVAGDIDKKLKKLMLILKIKFATFFVTMFSLMGMFWYYVTCFCGIYRNTQIHLIKDSLFSFTTSLITPFGIYLIPAFIRVYALKKKMKILYKFSQLLQMI